MVKSIIVTLSMFRTNPNMICVSQSEKKHNTHTKSVLSLQITELIGLKRACVTKH